MFIFRQTVIARWRYWKNVWLKKMEKYTIVAGRARSRDGLLRAGRSLLSDYQFGILRQNPEPDIVFLLLVII